MIKVIPINESHILAVRISGKLVEKDYVDFVPQLERILKKENKISLLIKLEEFEGWSAKAMLEDMKIGLTHDDDLLRIAIVGEKTWQKFMASIGNLFTDTKIDYFDEESSALEWLREITNKAEENEYVGYRHILVASDFSTYSKTALKKAIEIATPFKAKISVLHAAEVLSSDIYPSLGELSIPVLADNPDLEKKHLALLKKELDESIENFQYSSITTSVEVGRAADRILEFSSKEDVDLIVMGSHGRRGLARLIGSSTNGIVNDASCDVLVISSLIE